jgi:hypothetical protein
MTLWRFIPEISSTRRECQPALGNGYCPDERLADALALDWPEVARRRHLMRMWLQVPSWPRLPDNQGMHTAADHALWLRQRRQFMEVLSRYLAEMAQRKAALASAARGS